MTKTEHVVLVTGFLGAGKSTIAKHLSSAGDASPVEVSGLLTGGSFDRSNWVPRSVICAVDAANLQAQLDDPQLQGLVRAQIAEADLLVLTRTDLVEAAPALNLLKALTDTDIIAEPFGKVPSDALPLVRTREWSAVDLTDQFTSWSYDGPAKITPENAEAFLADRPAGVYRLCGVASSGTKGLELELAGRVRQTKPLKKAASTHLTALGLKRRFHVHDIDAVFSEKVAASVSRASLFGYR